MTTHNADMSEESTVPRFRAKSFVCPMCGTQAEQTWTDVWTGSKYGESDYRKERKAYAEVKCYACNKLAMWHQDDKGERMVWPPAVQGPPSNDDLPDTVRNLYDEARAVEGISPRSAAALLRTATEVLLREQIGKPDVRLNDAIGQLVSEGRLSPDIQKASDLLRLTGNDAVHPHAIQLTGDTGATGLSLFDLLNLVADELITRPKRIAAMYEALPAGKREHIAQRDGQVDTEE